MKVLENCKCMFEVEHKFISNNEQVGVIGHVESDYVTRYNFGLCAIPNHVVNKTETEKIGEEKN